jgi:putative membrane protein
MHSTPLEEPMKSIFLTGIAMIALPLTAVAQMSPAAPSATADSSTEASGSVGMAKLSVQDTHFIKVAAIAGMAEVSDGKLAADVGDSTVRNIGNTMVTDHTKANEQLMSIAKEKGIALPTQLDAQHAAVSAKLKTLSGASFDKYYLSTELKGHEMTIDAFKAEASTGSDPDLIAFANATLPTLEMHLSMIQAAMK